MSFGMADGSRGRYRIRGSALAVVSTVGAVVALVAALGILYLAFRGPSGGSATGAGVAAGGTVAAAQPSGLPPASVPATVPASAPATYPASVPAGTHAAAPHATAQTTGRPQASPLGPAVQKYLADRYGTVRVAVYDLATGQEWSLGDGAAQAEASIVKVNILETLLSQRPDGLTASDQALAQEMIEDSDNDAATSLWDEVGGATGISAYNAQARLTQTTPSACVQCTGFPWPGWGLTTTTPADQIALLRRLVEAGGPLTSAEREYVLSLMENVTAGQAWGVSGGVPAGVTVALKNGWLPLDDANTDWQINSIGWVSGDGRDYLLAMLSTGNPDEQYGIDTLNSVGSMVWSAMG
jgi:beta-lactamase class A